MSDTRSEFNLWVGRNTPEDAQVVECLEIQFPTQTYTICDWGQPFRATNENGDLIEYLPIGFNIESQKLGATTEQQLRIKVDGLNGTLYNLLRAIPVEERLDPVPLIHRLYLDTAPQAPVFVPPPTYYIKDVQATLSEVLLTATGIPLTQRRAGTAYTANQFPTLFYLT